MKDKVLLLVQGISDEANYIGKAVRAEFPIEGYAKVINIKTEKALDEAAKTSTPFWMKMLPKKVKDKGYDIWGFFTNKTAHAWVTSLVRDEIQTWQDKGYDVDLLGHSLGTLIILCSGAKVNPVKVNKFYSFSSPCGFEFAPLRYFVKWHVWRKSTKFRAKQIINVWGDDDYIARKMDEKTFKKRCKKYKGWPIPGLGHKAALLMRAWKVFKKKRK